MKYTTLTVSIISSLIVGLLVGWLIWRSGPMPHQMNHESMHSTMDGMTMALANKTGDAFDQEFLSQMIVHHEGAVVMAQQVLAQSKRPELIKLAHDIISAQTGEIDMMKGWQKEWFK